MTTDTKAVARFNFDAYHGCEFETDDGYYVTFTDHERVVADFVKVVDVHRGIIADFTEDIDKLRTALAASRAEVEGLKKDAERWRHARRILPVLYIEDSQEKHVIWARSADEVENLKADKAIDAAMEKGNVGP